MTNQPQTEEELALQLTLSQDELAVILRLNGVSRLPGFVIADDFNESHAEAAIRSLLARGIGTLNIENQIELDEGLRLMTLLGAMAPQTISVFKELHEGFEHHWFYIQPKELTIYHTSPQIGIQQFRTVLNSNQLMGTLLDVTLIEEPLAVNEEIVFELYTLHYDHFVSLLSESDEEQAQAYLSELDYAPTLTQLLSKPDVRSIISVVNTSNAQVDGKVVVVLQDKAAIWLLQRGAELTTIQQRDAAQLLVNIAEIITEL